MSHDVEAAYAAAELAAVFASDPLQCFGALPGAASLSAYATKEGRNQWPHADGLIALALNAGGAVRQFDVALEFKRTNEGTHGILTALGQSHAYLRKGYAGAAIVIPAAYPSLTDPGGYVRQVLEQTSHDQKIAVITYAPPDLSQVSPFHNRLTIHRPIGLDVAGSPSAAVAQNTRVETQWAHVREGSTDPDALFRYLQAVKLLSGGDYTPKPPMIPHELGLAVDRVQPGANVERYLSYTSGDTLADRAWRLFWFRNVLHDAAIRGWSVGAGGAYVPNPALSLIERADGKGKKKFMVGKTNSPKDILAAELNSGAKTVDQALENLVKGYHNRAHSYREDIDSGCEHLGFIDSEGRLTDSGYRFVDACERFGSGNATVPRAIFLEALLTEGGLGALLHYIYRLSAEAFQADPLAFCYSSTAAHRRLAFSSDDYLRWIEDQLANRLHVLRKVNPRGGVSRKPLQAELALLRQLGIVEQGFRIGVGLPVNWPVLQEAMSSVALH